MALSNLTLSLRQVSTSPPTIAVTLRNTSPDTHFTVLTWDTPFDPKAVALGIFRVKDKATAAEKGRQYSMRAVGRWKGVWPVESAQLQEDDLTALGGGSRCLTGEFESDEVNMSVQ